MWVGRLATVYLNDGRLDTAMPLYEEALKLRKANLGPEHPDTLGSIATLAYTLLKTDAWRQAETHHFIVPPVPHIEDTVDRSEYVRPSSVPFQPCKKWRHS